MGSGRSIIILMLVRYTVLILESCNTLAIYISVMMHALEFVKLRRIKQLAIFHVLQYLHAFCLYVLYVMMFCMLRQCLLELFVLIIKRPVVLLRIVTHFKLCISSILLYKHLRSPEPFVKALIF